MFAEWQSFFLRENTVLHLCEFSVHIAVCLLLCFLCWFSCLFI